MAENEKYVDGLTEAEYEDMAIIVNKTIEEICLFSDKHNFDRDNMLKYYAELIGTLAEISTIQDFEVEKPQTNADRIRNMSDEELLDFICSIETYEEGSVKTIENGVSMHTVTEVMDWLQSEAEMEKNDGR